MLCLCPAPAAPTPSTAPKEKQSQTPSSVGFSDDPPQDTSPALPLPLPLSPSPFQGETCRSNTEMGVGWTEPKDRQMAGPKVKAGRTSADRSKNPGAWRGTQSGRA